MISLKGGIILNNGHNDKPDRKRELDDFWNLEPFIKKKMISPKPQENTKNESFSVSPDVSRNIVTGGAEIEVSDGESVDSDEKITTITKFIPPFKGAPQDVPATPILEYCPENSLIHRVQIYSGESAYEYYADFLRDAEKYNDRTGKPCGRVPFFSYVPQYDQMNPAQLDYYFWWRENIRTGRVIPADISYIMLYIYEILNLHEILQAEFAQSQLVLLWREYGAKYPRLCTNLAEWITDYSFVRRLGPPEVSADMLESPYVFREFYLVFSPENPADFAGSLLKFCCSYNWCSSKFATPENRPLFETHVPQAITEVLRHFYCKGGFMSGMKFTDTKKIRDAYSGALCSYKIKFRVAFEYSSFSKSHDLRFIVGDMVKYSENKIRAHLGIKSRLGSLFSLPSEIRTVIDAYFEKALPKKNVRATVKEEPQEYDSLYDIPRRKLSLSEAERIEKISWETTGAESCIRR